MALADRPTPDLIVMFLAALVGLIITGFLIGAIWLQASGTMTEGELERIGRRLVDVLNTLIGAIVGYLAGRGVNGKPTGGDSGP